MGDDGVKTVQLVYEAFGRGDVPTILEHLTDDVDWAAETVSDVAPWFGVKHGKEAVVGFFTALAETIDVLEFTPLVYAASGDEVLTVVPFRARATGKEVDTDLHHRWTFRAGRIARYRGTEDLAQTIAALTP